MKKQLAELMWEFEKVVPMPYSTGMSGINQEKDTLFDKTVKLVDIPLEKFDSICKCTLDRNQKVEVLMHYQY